MRRAPKQRGSAGQQGDDGIQRSSALRQFVLRFLGPPLRSRHRSAGAGIRDVGGAAPYKLCALRPHHRQWRKPIQVKLFCLMFVASSPDWMPTATSSAKSFRRKAWQSRCGANESRFTCRRWQRCVFSELDLIHRRDSYALRRSTVPLLPADHKSYSRCLCPRTAIAPHMCWSTTCSIIVTC